MTDINPKQSEAVSSDSADYAKSRINGHASKSPGNGTPAAAAAVSSGHQGTEMSHDHEKSGHVGEIKDKITKKKDKIRDKTKPKGGYDTTPTPDVPPGYTIKITFHRAANLPIADLRSSSCDPFIEATLTSDLPLRHKEDPRLVHRTKTMHRTTEPAWDECWIVGNIPPSGFSLKCRLYDEDVADRNDRLGNVTIAVAGIGDTWQGFDHKVFSVKKRMGSKRAYLRKAVEICGQKDKSMTAHLELSMQLLGKTESPGGAMFTLGPNTWTRHFSPTIGRLAGTLAVEDESALPAQKGARKQPKKYDFQACEIQLQGPVPQKLYHRFVEFRPIMALMFSSRGLRGRILNTALHKQHSRIYNFDQSTEYGNFKPCSDEATQLFLKLTNFGEGGRMFTYVLTLDGVLRFTMTGKEFGIDLLSKHTMHADVAIYIAFSGEFLIRRRPLPAKSTSSITKSAPNDSTHPQDPNHDDPHTIIEAPDHQPSAYQIVIDNDSGTYRPDKSLLPTLQEYLQSNFPGLEIVAMHWERPELQKMKDEQVELQKKKKAKQANQASESQAET